MVRHWTFVVACCAASLAHAQNVDVRFDADGQFAHSGAVAPGQALELCAPLGAAQAVDSRFSATGALDYNVHHHVGDEVVYLELEKGIDRHVGRLEPESADTYCWMWENKGSAAVNVNAALQRGAG
ncbi:MAG: hypothetical protein R3233_07020 [Xanthomonadales bacterium]|nr:hypothetical protein [Xanthomonadales bacterium]